MVAYSFQRQFVDPMLDGVKDQTIRAKRAGHNAWRVGGHAQPGQGLQLYVGMRTKSCHLVLRTVCVDVLPVQLRWRPAVEFHVAGIRMAVRDMDAFARRDGFADCSEMELFWADHHRGGPVFDGWLIRWRAPAARAAMGDIIALPEAA